MVNIEYQIPPGTAYFNAIAEEQLGAFAEKWLEHRIQHKDPAVAGVESLKELMASTYCFPDLFWMRLAEAIARPYPRKILGSLDENATPKMELVPYALFTVHNRVDHVITAHNRLRPRVPCSTQVGQKLHLYIDQELREKHKLKDPQLKDYATFRDVLLILEKGVFGAKLKTFWKAPREKLQMSALISLLFFTAARPGDILLSKGYEKCQEALQYSDLEFEFIWRDTAWQFRCNVSIRNQKGMKGNRPGHRISPLYEAEDLPAHANTSWLLLGIAIEDEALEDFADLSSFDAFNRKSNNTGSDVFPLPIKESKKNLNVFRQYVHGETQSYELHPSRSWTVDSAQHLFRKVANAAGMAKLKFYSLRRGAASALDRIDVTEHQARKIMGHTDANNVLRNAYTSPLAKVDLLGILLRGHQDTIAIQPKQYEVIPYKDLTAEEDLAVTGSVEVTTLQKRMEAMRSQLKSKHGSIGKAETAKGTDWVKYKQIAHEISALKLLMRRTSRLQRGQEGQQKRRKLHLASIAPLFLGSEGQSEDDASHKGPESSVSANIRGTESNEDEDYIADDAESIIDDEEEYDSANGDERDDDDQTPIRDAEEDMLLRMLGEKELRKLYVAGSSYAIE